MSSDQLACFELLAINEAQHRAVGSAGGIAELTDHTRAITHPTRLQPRKKFRIKIAKVFCRLRATAIIVGTK